MKKFGKLKSKWVNFIKPVSKIALKDVPSLIGYSVIALLLIEGYIGETLKLVGMAVGASLLAHFMVGSAYLTYLKYKKED